MRRYGITGRSDMEESNAILFIIRNVSDPNNR